MFLGGLALFALIALALNLAAPAEETAQTIAAVTVAPEAPSTSQSTTTTWRDYTSFDDIEPRYSVFFVGLESTTLAAEQGESRLYGLGIGVCRNLDRGTTIDEELRGLVDDSKLSAEDAGALVGAAVGDMCPHHGALVERYLAEH